MREKYRNTFKCWKLHSLYPIEERQSFSFVSSFNGLTKLDNGQLIFNGPSPASFSFIFVFSNKHHNFYNK